VENETKQDARDDPKRRWWRWHKENPHVYQMFERFTFEAIRLGHRQLSAWLIVNRIRWETAVVTRGDDFKVSNDFIAYYARLFMALHPEYDGFFRTKSLKHERQESEAA
jgi:hypothetical protein